METKVDNNLNRQCLPCSCAVMQRLCLCLRVATMGQASRLSFNDCSMEVPSDLTLNIWPPEVWYLQNASSHPPTSCRPRRFFKLQSECLGGPQGIALWRCPRSALGALGFRCSLPLGYSRASTRGWQVSGARANLDHRLFGETRKLGPHTPNRCSEGPQICLAGRGYDFQRAGCANSLRTYLFRALGAVLKARMPQAQYVTLTCSQFFAGA